MLVMSNSKNELVDLINELSNLQIRWNLRLNKKKSEILTREESNEINGFKCSKSVKYNGIRVELNKKDKTKIAKK